MKEDARNEEPLKRIPSKSSLILAERKKVFKK